MPIITKVVSSNPFHGKMYSIQHYVIKFVSDLRQVGGFLCHDITEILLKVALNTINQTLSEIEISVKIVLVNFQQLYKLYDMNIHNNVIVKKRYLPKKYIRKDMDANEHERLSNITFGTQIKVKEHHF